MPRIKKANRVHAYCEYHGFTEHIEYVFYDAIPKYVCVRCKHLRPHEYGLYGWKPPSIPRTKETEYSKNEFGRQVV